MSLYWLWLVPPACVVGSILYAKYRPLTLAERASVLAVETFERHFEKFTRSGYGDSPLGCYRMGDLKVHLRLGYEGTRASTVTTGTETLPIWRSLQTRLYARAQRPIDLQREADLANSAKNLAEMVIKLEQGL